MCQAVFTHIRSFRLVNELKKKKKRKRKKKKHARGHTSQHVLWPEIPLRLVDSLPDLRLSISIT